jgi:hypothetical protein
MPDKPMRLLSDEWETTQQIARRAGIEWRPGSSWDLAPLRRILYAMELRGLAEHQERHNGHLWRKAQPAVPEGGERSWLVYEDHNGRLVDADGLTPEAKERYAFRVVPEADRA